MTYRRQVSAKSFLMKLRRVLCRAKKCFAGLGMHTKWMKLAIEEAKKSREANEVPIGAVAVLNGVCVARAGNTTQLKNSVVGHAEMGLLQDLQQLGSHIHPDLEVYVTVEPCVMCYTALSLARVRIVYFALANPKYGASEIIAALPNVYKKTSLVYLAGFGEAHSLMQEFFVLRR